MTTATNDLCLAALSVADDVLRSAITAAAAGRWAECPEQRFDAALRILEGARLLPGRPAPGADLGPFLEWDEDSDGWIPWQTVRAACYGDASAARNAAVLL